MAYIVYSKETGERLAEYKNKETLEGLNLDKCYFVESKPICKMSSFRIGADMKASVGLHPNTDHVILDRKMVEAENKSENVKTSDSSDYTRNLAISLLTLF